MASCPDKRKCQPTCAMIIPGELSKCRPSMFKRETFYRAPMAASICRARILPGKDFTYGRKLPDCHREMGRIMHWNPPPPKPQYRPHDFERINRLATQYGIHKVRDWMDFEKSTNIRLKNAKTFHRKLHEVKAPKDETYGFLIRPEPPIGCLLAHSYKTAWDNKMKKRMMEPYERKHTWNNALSTCAEFLPFKKVPKETEKYRDLEGYPERQNKVKPYVCTFRRNQCLHTERKIKKCMPERQEPCSCPVFHEAYVKNPNAYRTDKYLLIQKEDVDNRCSSYWTKDEKVGQAFLKSLKRREELKGYVQPRKYVSCNKIFN